MRYLTEEELERMREFLLNSKWNRADKRIIYEVIRSRNINATLYYDDETFIIKCIKLSDLEGVKLALSLGSEILTTNDRPSPLLLACSKGNLEIVKEIQHKLGKHCVIPSTLEIAAKYGYLEIAELLLNYGIYPKPKNDFGLIGSNAYDVAMCYNQSEIKDLFDEFIERFSTNSNLEKLNTLTKKLL